MKRRGSWSLSVSELTQARAPLAKTRQQIRSRELPNGSLSQGRDGAQAGETASQLALAVIEGECSPRAAQVWKPRVPEKPLHACYCTGKAVNSWLKKKKNCRDQTQVSTPSWN